MYRHDNLVHMNNSNYAPVCHFLTDTGERALRGENGERERARPCDSVSDVAGEAGRGIGTGADFTLVWGAVVTGVAAAVLMAVLVGADAAA